MKERPIGHLVDALNQLNADVRISRKQRLSASKNYRLKPLSAGDKVTIDGSISSQFLTAILMVAPLLKTDTTIEIEGELFQSLILI